MFFNDYLTIGVFGFVQDGMLSYVEISNSSPILRVIMQAAIVNSYLKLRIITLSQPK